MKTFSTKFGTILLTFTIGTTAALTGLSQSASKDTISLLPYDKKFATPTRAAKQKTLEMVFVIDTTGSMGGLIDGAKQKVWSIVNEVMQRKDRPNVKIGLVAYRDNGDAYVTQITALTSDLDKIYSNLMDFRAAGGGDTPENVRRALAEGVEKAGWSKNDSNTAQILFLVGDAPPHNDYAQEPDVLASAAKAVKANMIINTIQCGGDDETRKIWQTIAQRGEGKYFAIAQDGGVQNISTPFDAELGELANKIGTTYLAYGGGLGEAGVKYRAALSKEQSTVDLKVAKDAPMAAQADRAMNKAINANAYSNDLLQALENNTLKLEDVKTEELPDSLQKLTPGERKQKVGKLLAERKEIRAKIIDLSKKRDEFIKAELAKTGKQDGFDSAVAAALREQMLRKGIN